MPTGVSAGSSGSRNKRPYHQLSTDAQLLTRIVTKAGEEDLRQTLVSSIATAAPSQLEALKVLLDPLVTATLNPLHCVRCHKPYVEQENTWRSCNIPHEQAIMLDDDDKSSDYPCSEPSAYDEYGKWYELMQYPCCGERIRETKVDDQEELPVPKREPCVSTKHTSDPGQVEYYVGEVELPPKKKYDYRYHWSKYRGQNPNVVPCSRRKGCPTS
ncbi:hypothetical protein FRC12_019399 [Ceratobasidium sp. 428]|nr:hypothetical protein FRC12_019399 [Ceratobasidium sp. 428]